MGKAKATCSEWRIELMSNALERRKEQKNAVIENVKGQINNIMTAYERKQKLLKAFKEKSKN